MKQTYFVSGMHCASCEILIENKLKTLPGVTQVKASTNAGKVEVECISGVAAPNVNDINALLKKDHYTVSATPLPKKALDAAPAGGWLTSLVIVGVIFCIFWIFSGLGLGQYVSLSATSGLPVFFGFGVLASLSSCAALVGAIILSMSEQWTLLYGADEKSWTKKMHPHFLFNVGRLGAYIVGGAILGALGNSLHVSLRFTSLLIILVSILMFLLALQMLGVKALRNFKLALPRGITRHLANEKNFEGRFMPLSMGAATFLLPCGFTITVQGLALISGNAVSGALMLGAFALGTMPVLLGIGASSSALSVNKKLSVQFMRVAGFLVLFFALYNINAQVNVLGGKSLSDFAFNNSTNTSDPGLPPIENGVQIVKMDAGAYGYNPSVIRVRANVPIEWRVTDVGTTGCTSILISRALLKAPVFLRHNQTSTASIPALAAGTYKFSCSMGMVTGQMVAE